MLTSIDKYSARLTGNPFLFFEIKEVAKLFNQGLSTDEIKAKVIDENLFQYKTFKSIPKRLGAAFERLSALDEKLLELLLNETNETGRLIVFYSILKTDTLFFDFMKEVVYEKYQTHQYLLQKSDIDGFLDIKAEQSDIVAGFTPATINKLKQVYIKILLEAGYIKDKNKSELEPPIINADLASHLKLIGDQDYLKVMLGGSF